MAKYFNILVLFSFLLIVSCQEGREAGDLLGQWRMTGSDSKYVSFSGSLVWFKSTSQGDTALIEESFGLKPFDDIHLKIESLSSDKLVIRNAQQAWSFYKY